MDRNRKAEYQEEQRRANKQAAEERMARFEKSEAGAKERRDAAKVETPAEEKAQSETAAASE